MKKLIIVLICLTLFSVAMAKPKVELVQSENKVDVLVDGKAFTSYVYGDNLPKSSLVPVRTTSGLVVTRRYPLVELPDPHDNDHEHHVGIYFAVDYVNGTKFWNNTKTSPQIKHISIDSVTGGDGKGILTTTSEWVDKKKVTVLEEKRKMALIDKKKLKLIRKKAKEDLEKAGIEYTYLPIVGRPIADIKPKKLVRG